MGCSASVGLIQEHKETQTTPHQRRRLNDETTSLKLPSAVPQEEVVNETNSATGVPSISDDVKELEDDAIVKVTNTFSEPTVVALQTIKSMEITESDIQKEIENHRWREKLNAETLEKQRNLTKLRLQQKLEQRRMLRQTKVEDTVLGKTNTNTMRNTTTSSGTVNEQTVMEEAHLKQTCLQVQTINKEVLYSGNSTDLFSELEDYAIRLESSNVSFSELMENLFIKELSDLEKVRIIFHWISSQDLNSISFPNDLNQDSPLGYLQQIKTENKTYPSLFVRLCSAAGLFAKEIQGYVKGHGYYPDHKFSATTDQRGSWNAVLVDKQWRLIDTHWGARSVIDDDEDKGTAKSENVVYEYEEHYFLTDPEHLIKTHFPDDTAWQLLPDSITLAQFEDYVRQWPLFYKLKLSLLSHKSGVIHADQHGYVQIKLGVPPFARSDADFYGELRLRKKRSEKFPRYVLHYVNKDKEVFDVFLPHPGKYLFYIFGKSTKFMNQGNNYTWICCYQIECSNITSQPSGLLAPPFTANALCYGPSKKMSDLRVYAISHPGPTVECDCNGEATLKFSFSKSRMPISFLHGMEDVNSAEVGNAVVRSVEYLESKDVALLVFVRVPANGNYCLTLFYCDGEGSSDTHSSFVQYLIVSQKQSSRPHVLFPEIQSVGPMQPSFDNLGLSISTDCGSSVSQHWIKFKRSGGECIVLIEHAEPITLLVDLKCINEEYNEYVLIATDQNNSVIILRPPPTITDHTAILALNIFAAPLGTSVGVPCVYSALVSGITEYNQDIKAFIPSPSIKWGPVTSVREDEMSVKFINSDPAILEKKVQGDTFPYRKYKGGDDFKMVLQSEKQIEVILGFSEGNEENNSEHDDFTMISESSFNRNTIQARFPKAGMYKLSVFAKSLEDTGNSYSPWYHTLIEALAPSKCKNPFPKSYALWNASCCQLFTPLEGKIKRNVPVKFCLKLAKYNPEIESKTSSYAKVFLQPDGCSVEEPNRCNSDFVYEWDYVSGPSESIVRVVIQEKHDDTTVHHVLEFSVV